MPLGKTNAFSIPPEKQASRMTVSAPGGTAFVSPASWSLSKKFASWGTSASTSASPFSNEYPCPE